MKQIILKTGFIIAIFFAAVTSTSCGDNMNEKDSKDLAEDNNDAKFTSAMEEDAEYLVSAAEIDMEGIELGQLAQKNSTTPSVIQLGKMMEDDHTKSLKDLKTLATKKQITLPTTLTSDNKNAYDKIKNKFGYDFDKEYSNMLVEEHKDAINKFEKVSTNAKDPEIQSWAATFLILLRAHLDHSIACQQQCEKMKSKS